ncbi:ATP-dependent DNA helicase [Halomonas sp. CH40]
MKVAVRSLCEFAARTGSLEYRYTPSPSAEEGIAGHQWAQSQRPAGYQAEYLLEGACLGVQLRGRADGYHADATPVYLEEIKTHRGDLSRIGAGQHRLHWAQLKVYGALLCQRDGLDEVELRLVYVDISSHQETVEQACMTRAELMAELEALCRRFKAWHRQEQQHRGERDQALQQLRFPFADFRPHQRSLSETVYKAASTQRTLLLEAPTGLGKTLGVLFPALMAMPAQQLDRLFVLTARTTGREPVLASLQQLVDTSISSTASASPLPLRIVELTAKEKACEYPDRACHGDSCPLASGFFDRLPAAREAAAKARWLTRQRLQQLAAEHAICPYYLGQEMARWSDVVVGDVNHYFDRQALLYGLTRQNRWRVMPLVDEAHNLVERARGMYSARLRQADVSSAKRAAPKSLASTFEALQRAWRRLIKTYDSEQASDEPLTRYLEEVPSELNRALQRLVNDLTAYMTEHAVVPELQTLLFDALGFMRLMDDFGEHSLCSVTLVSRQNRQGGRARPGRLATLAIDNVVPGDLIAERFKAAHACVLFSATLTPTRFYRDLLSLPPRTVAQTIASPFRAAQVEVRYPRISTRYRDRERSLAPIAQRVSRQYAAQPGNYLIYLSSFAYLQRLQHHLAAVDPSLPLHAQQAGMREAEREAFIEVFRRQRGVVGLAVLGGVFAEGIDLPGDALVGVYIATLGLPPFGHFQQAQAARLQARFGQGDDDTYLYPGLQKVVQAAGRVIRSPDDNGLIELLDDRFTAPKLQALLPGWWKA